MTDRPLLPPSLISAARYAATALVTWWLVSRGVDGLTVANLAAGFMQLLVAASWALDRWWPQLTVRAAIAWVRDRLT